MTATLPRRGRHVSARTSKMHPGHRGANHPVKDRPVFSVQYHPEASPGPHDSHTLFERFVAAIEACKKSR